MDFERRSWFAEQWMYLEGSAVLKAVEMSSPAVWVESRSLEWDDLRLGESLQEDE